MSDTGKKLCRYKQQIAKCDGKAIVAMRDKIRNGIPKTQLLIEIPKLVEKYPKYIDNLYKRYAKTIVK